MATDLGPEFSEKYNAISNKLKKRFMRKPNVSEAAEEFCELATECEHAEQPSYAGLCYMGAAGCEASVGNAIGEAEYLLASARQFMGAEKKLASLLCVSPASENLEAGLSCYSHASKRYPEKSCLRSCINLEVAHDLEKLGRFHEAEKYYQNATENYTDNPGHMLICFRNLASVYIKQEKYSEALDIYEKIDELANERRYELFIRQCEINRLFLYLIVQPSPKTTSESLRRLLKRYTMDFNAEEPDFQNTIVDPELALNLQSVLTACNVGDLKTLVNFQTELKDSLSIEQQDLYRKVISVYQSMK